LTLTESHLWLDVPLSRGGSDNIGGTTPPCDNLPSTSNISTTIQGGTTYRVQFRVNLHSNLPWGVNIANSQTSPVFSTNLASGINFNDIPTTGSISKYIDVKIPNENCDFCTLQLTGMGWYQCANIKIVAGAPTLMFSLLIVILIVLLI